MIARRWRTTGALVLAACAVAGTATTAPGDGCRVTLRYICRVARANNPQSVFGQMLAGFEIAAADPRLVSLNLVQPEDDPLAVRDSLLQMRMLDYRTLKRMARSAIEYSFADAATKARLTTDLETAFQALEGRNRGPRTGARVPR